MDTDKEVCSMGGEIGKRDRIEMLRENAALYL